MSVVVHSKPGCVYCDRAEALLRDLNVPYTKVMYLPESDGYAERRDALFVRNAHRSFPHVFVGDVFVGGFKELQASASTNALDKLLNDIGLSIEDTF